ncbi:MAG: FG-GAP-like repeat-containing protein [Candidatus Manganitrophus sp.]|nr:MAG: FG-GAP-like repeat-containing protein [Candidatus Manganitrophus sp.]
MIALSLHACGRGGGSRHRGGRPPGAPAGVAVTAFSGAVVIGWDPVEGATSYHVYVAASSGVTKANYETLPFGKRNPAAAGPFTQSDLFDGTTYYFVVTALNEAGESVESAEVSATPMSTALPLPPTGLRAIAADGQVTLEWNSVTGASSYFLYRATVSGINRDNWNTIVGGNRTQVPGGATVYIEDSLANGTTYFFVVTAQNSLGQSQESVEVSATPFAADTVPVQPTNLTASAADSEVILHWNAAAGAQFYNVYWGTAAGVTPDNGTKISNLSGTSYTHTALTNNTTYHYILTAENAHGESLPSEEASATPIPAPPPAVVTLPPSEVLKTGTAILHGKVNPLGFSGETTVSFQWGTTTAYENGSVSTDPVSGGTSFEERIGFLAGLIPHRSYHYRIMATNSRGTSFGADQSFILPFLGDLHEFLVEPDGSPNDVVVARFNNDNIDDLAVINQAKDSVSILFGTGIWTGTTNVGFEGPIPYAVGDNPQYVAAGKFHGNNSPSDLIVSNNTSGTITLLSNNGSGVFTATSVDLWIDPGDSGRTFPSDLVVADFNGDLKDDLAVASVMNGVGNVVVLLGDGVGGFNSKTLFLAGISPSGIAAGDLDNDGSLDLAVTNKLTNKVLLLRGDGSGSFGAPDEFLVGDGTSSYLPMAVVIENFNGDTDANAKPYLDLAVVNNASSTISVLINDTAGGFNPPTGFAVGLQPYDVAAARFNPTDPNDPPDPADLVVPNIKADTVTVHLGSGNGTFGTSLDVDIDSNNDIDRAPVAVAIGDFNSDGKSDVVVVNKSWNSVSILLGQ